eukprot:46582_1
MGKDQKLRQPFYKSFFIQHVLIPFGFTPLAQYSPTLVIVFILSFLTTLIFIIGRCHFTLLFKRFALLTFIFLIVSIVELITVKLALRPSESKPCTTTNEWSIFR